MRKPPEVKATMLTFNLTRGQSPHCPLEGLHTLIDTGSHRGCARTQTDLHALSTSQSSGPSWCPSGEWHRAPPADDAECWVSVGQLQRATRPQHDSGSVHSTLLPQPRGHPQTGHTLTRTCINTQTFPGHNHRAQPLQSGCPEHTQDVITPVEDGQTDPQQQKGQQGHQRSLEHRAGGAGDSLLLLEEHTPPAWASWSR